MGLAAVVHQLIEDTFGKDAFFYSRKPTLDKVRARFKIDPDRRMIAIHDFLTSLHNVSRAGERCRPGEENPDKFMFTGDEFWELTWQRISDRLNSKKYKGVVICIDDPNHVTKLKAATQAKRSSTVHEEQKAYGNILRFCAGGILLEAKTGEDEEGPPITGEKRSEGGEAIIVHGERPGIDYAMRFDLRCVIHDRKGRVLLWQFLKECLKEAPIPYDTFVVLDYDNSNPTVFDWGGWRDIPHYGHTCGEADKGIFFWARVFRQYGIVLDTVDTDAIAVGVHFVEQTKPEDAILWLKDAITYVDMRVLAKKSTEGLTYKKKGKKEKRWHSRRLMLTCILCETDFFKKSMLTHFIGVDDIWRAMNSNDLDPYLNARDFAVTEDLIYDITQKIYRLKQGTGESLKSIRAQEAAKPKTRLKVPDLDTVNRATELIHANMDYWCPDWTARDDLCDVPLTKLMPDDAIKDDIEDIDECVVPRAKEQPVEEDDTGERPPPKSNKRRGECGDDDDDEIEPRPKKQRMEDGG